ncbi:type II toxin-antitoxin system RelE/ParE family toxin [Iningainema tapete]|uniref:Type II toxin-antitoxin system RelE/ParE family toxin n=1 Tax=Iningainema tapete BLCC-T55 TaxID=2748662 RepID=A0A8J6XID9_9CYAN|nr:type II toxin-antitoxin system RelE/ParE family toxin [Iningainema tapete]MBD2771934.1 type II toxin-antitoxin system RelE/ParE family toxin [Iningainema tapete BLCC-T55]
MLRDLIILPKAEQDAAEAYTWYEEQEPGLGEDFLRCVDACIQLIRRNPQMYRLVHENYRRAVVRRFPYVVFYEYLDNTIIVYSVFHSSQDPNKWRNQLP